MAPSDSHTHAQLSLTACSADKPCSVVEDVEKALYTAEEIFESSLNK